MPGSLGTRYVYSTKHIEEVFKKIADTGRPESLTTSYLKNTWLLKNAQYQAVLPILKDLGFIDASGKPTERYALYQNPQKARKAVADGVRQAYPELFKAYPQADKLPHETLKGVFKEKTGGNPSIVDKIVATFKKLCTLGDFSSLGPRDRSDTDQTGLAHRQSQRQDSVSSPLPITMNIQIVIPSDATPEQYDAIFSSIKKNLVE